MSQSALGARRRRDASERTRNGRPSTQFPLVNPDLFFANGNGPQVARVSLAQSTRIALMLTPHKGAKFRQQAEETLEKATAALRKHASPITVTSQTVFLRDPTDQQECEEMLRSFYGKHLPVTTFVHQPPCCGAALALEAWAVGGPTLKIERFGSHAVALNYNGVRWIYCGGIKPGRGISGVYAQTTDALKRLRRVLEKAGTSFEHVARTWFYLGGITDLQSKVQRYQELNRARTDFYRGMNFNEKTLMPGSKRPVYPASTGIGMSGRGLALSCTAFETNRKDAFLLPLENPLQTPAYHYHPRYSPQSPKFSRAVALVPRLLEMTGNSGVKMVK